MTGLSPAMAPAPVCILGRLVMRDAGWIRALAEGAGLPDADILLDLARTHRLVAAAQAGWVALEAAGVLPPVPANWTAEAKAARLGTLAKTGHLAAIARAFGAADIAWFALKGPALGAHAYDDPNERACIDLDLLVRPDHADRAVDILQASGWRPPADWRARLADGRTEEVTLLPGRPLQPQIDLHVELDRPRSPFRADPFAGPGPATIMLGGVAVPVLPDPDLLVYVTWHGMRHWYARLHWLVDVARLAERGFDPDAALARARALGTERCLRASLGLAQEILGVTPPRLPDADPATAAAVRRIMAWGRAALVDGAGLDQGGPDQGGAGRLGFYRWRLRDLALIDDAAGRLHLVRGWLRPPVDETVPSWVPGWLHAGLRPAFVLARIAGWKGGR